MSHHQAAQHLSQVVPARLASCPGRGAVVLSLSSTATCCLLASAKTSLRSLTPAITMQHHVTPLSVYLGQLPLQVKAQPIVPRLPDEVLAGHVLPHLGDCTLAAAACTTRGWRRMAGEVKAARHHASRCMCGAGAWAVTRVLLCKMGLRLAVVCAGPHHGPQTHVHTGRCGAAGAGARPGARAARRPAGHAGLRLPHHQRQQHQHRLAAARARPGRAHVCAARARRQPGGARAGLSKVCGGWVAVRGH